MVGDFLYAILFVGLFCAALGVIDFVVEYLIPLIFYAIVGIVRHCAWKVSRRKISRRK